MAIITQNIKRLLQPDTIGPEECPILHRWTLFPPGMGSRSSSRSNEDGSDNHLPIVPDWMPKLLLHHFMPQADERHSHDHPRGFWTFVLRGGYDDMVPCTRCGGTGRWMEILACSYCWRVGSADRSEGVVVGEVMHPGMLRYRSANHIHRTRVHSKGAWTLVLMGPKRREWGFHLGNGEFVEWKTYFKKYGFGMRCV